MTNSVYRLTVTADDAGQRLDQFLAARCEALSRTMARKVIDIGGVHLDGRRMRRCAEAVRSGQQAEVFLDGLPLETFVLTPEHVLFQDASLIVIDKPSGIATQPTPARFKGTLYDALQKHLTGTGQRGKPSIGMVQRLDRDTSGVIIFSIHPRAHKGLTGLFRDRRVRKTYLALVAGRISDTAGIIRTQLARRRSSNLTVSVAKGGKPAETRFKLREYLPGASLLEVEIPTGRSHQIRAHFGEQGHPLLGDIKYGGPAEIAGREVPRQLLHANQLELLHPVNGESLVFTAELPKDFLAILQHLRQMNSDEIFQCKGLGTESKSPQQSCKKS